jgi:CheY-like chemotaxis protein
VSRILVADDNSNIQKMVALALKDEGIDVVAVGNGDAAIRKIPDLRPDLILADIFMPVRSGYEVCEFVKSDSRYMNTPVVLLVGAFDPLDEQETQRVRADGVLKKPFVPPDPLINMVKALLARSNGQKLVPVMAATPAKAATPPPIASAPASPAGPANPVDAAPAEALPRQAAKITPPTQAAPPSFVMPAPPAASRTAKAEDSDEVVTSSRDPNLGEPFWATPAEPQEPEEKSESETEPKDMIDMHSFGMDEPSVEEEDDRSHFRPDTPNLDGGDFSADLSEATVSKNEAPAPEEASGSQPAVPGEYESNIVIEESGSQQISAPSASPEAPEIFKFDPALTFPDATPNAPIEEGSSEAHRASFAEPELLESPADKDAATLSHPAGMASAGDMPGRPLDTHEPVGPIELNLPSLPNREAVITAATEAARLAFSELNTLPGSGASAESSDGHASVMEQKDSPSAFAPTAAQAPSPEMIEAVVNRLLQRMQPQIIEVVNREVLRPAIEEIVRKEMKKD